MAKRKTKSALQTRPKRKSVKARKSSSASAAAAAAQEQLYQTLKRYIRIRGPDYLRDRNVTSIGIAHKNGDGPVCLRFSVARKGNHAIRTRDSYRIPKTIQIDGLKVQTDVVEGTFALEYERVEPATINERHRMVNPIRPGFSVSNAGIDSGTIGLIVFDRHTGWPCILSNWHVLKGMQGRDGDAVIQPGRSDFDPAPGRRCAKLLRGVVNEFGDGALAALLTPAEDPQARVAIREIHGLNVAPTGLAEVRIGDRVIKSGLATGVTQGIVTAVQIKAMLEIDNGSRLQRVTCFEISPDRTAPPLPNGIATYGDSGSAWMIFQGGRPTGLFAGLHFSGGINLRGEKTAYACYARSLQAILEFDLLPPG